MDKIKIVIEHDFFSRKPIYITFKFSVVLTSTGDVLHQKIFKHRFFDYGLYEAERYKGIYSQPIVIFALMAADISNKLNFKVNTNKGFDQFMADSYENSSTELLFEYLTRTKHEKDRETIITELKKRGEIHREKDDSARI